MIFSKTKLVLSLYY